MRTPHKSKPTANDRLVQGRENSSRQVLNAAKARLAAAEKEHAAARAGVQAAEAKLTRLTGR
jgi:hypothetical protein